MSGQDSDIEILEVAMILIANLITGIYILAISLPKLNREEFEGLLEKRKEKGGKRRKKKKVIKCMLKYLYEV